MSTRVTRRVAPLRAFLVLMLIAGTVAVEASLGQAATGSDMITTVAGNGIEGDTTQEGPATRTSIRPTHVAVAPAGTPNEGTVYYSEGTFGYTAGVWQITRDGELSQFAGGGTGFVEGARADEVAMDVVNGIDVGDDGTVYFVTGYPDFDLFKVTTGGQIFTVSDGMSDFLRPAGIAVGNGFVYIADVEGHVIHVVAIHSGQEKIFFGVKDDSSCGRIMEDPDGGGPDPLVPAHPWGKLDAPVDVEFWGGDLYVADRNNNAIWRIPANNPWNYSTVFGKTATWNECQHPDPNVVIFPRGVETDGDDVYYTSWQHAVHEAELGVVAGTSGSAGFSGDGGPAASAELNRPEGLALSSTGALYIADTGNFRIRGVDVPPPSACPGFASDPRNQVVGTPGSETLTGTTGADLICGLGGNDRLEGGGSNDLLLGGEGNDSLSGSAGTDRLDGGGGKDSLSGGAGGDILIGGLSGDTATYGGSPTGVTVDLSVVPGTGTGGDAQGDSLTGIENLWGTGHVDSLTGSTAANTIRGYGSGDTLKGLGGTDTLDYTSSTAGVIIDLRSSPATVSGGHATGDVATLFERVVGSSLGDVLRGNNLANWLTGAAGSDSLFGYGGNDRLLGQAGIDSFDGGPGTDSCDDGTGESHVNCE